MLGLQKTKGFSNKELESMSYDMAKFAELASNIGSIGQAIDFSNNTQRAELQNQYPAVAWLLATSMSRMARQASENGLAPIHQDANTGEWMIMVPYSVGTLPPTDTTGACCWVPLDIAKCGAASPLAMLCLKDCAKIMDNLINKIRRAGGNDLIGWWQREGETVREAQTRMAKESMAFFTAYNVLFGLTTAETETLKPFHGLLEVMENPAVVSILGTNILGAFEMLGCRITTTKSVPSQCRFLVHPLTLAGIRKAVQPDRFDRYPDGWTKSENGTLTFMGIEFLEDSKFIVDMTAGLGEVWFLDGDVLGVYLATGLMPDNEDFVREIFASNDTPADGCAAECTYYYNIGGVFTNDHRRLAVINNIPLDAACLGNTLQGLEGQVQPDTLIPMN